MEPGRLQLCKFPFMSDCFSQSYLSPLALEHEGLPRLCPPTLGWGGCARGLYLVPWLVLILLPSVARGPCLEGSSLYPPGQVHMTILLGPHRYPGLP